MIVVMMIILYFGVSNLSPRIIYLAQRLDAKMILFLLLLLSR